jgi:hypothetical protein
MRICLPNYLHTKVLIAILGAFCSLSTIAQSTEAPIKLAQRIADRVIAKTPFDFRLGLQKAPQKFGFLTTVDFGRTYGLGKQAMAYAYSNIEVNKDTTVTFTVSHSDGLQVYINYEKMYDKRATRPYAQKMDERAIILEDAFTVKLLKGSNSIVLKSETAGKEWKVGANKNNVFALNLKVNYSGGRRFIPINEQASQANGKEVFDYNNAYKDRQQDYFRTDIKISYKKNSKKFAQEFALDIQNVFNTQNVLNQTFNPKTGQVSDIHVLRKGGYYAEKLQFKINNLTLGALAVVLADARPTTLLQKVSAKC